MASLGLQYSDNFLDRPHVIRYPYLVAIEKSIRPQIKAHPETCDSSLRAQTMRSGMRTSAAPHRNTEVFNAQVIGTWL